MKTRIRRRLASFLLVPLLLSCSADNTEEREAETGVTEEATRIEQTSPGSEESPTGESDEMFVPAPDSGPDVGLITAVSGDQLPSLGQVDFSLVPAPAPELEWKLVDGERRSLKDYRGSVLLVNFWGTWCPPCRRELPDIVAVRDEFRDRGFEVIGVAVNERPTGGRSIPENLATFAEANNLHYPLIISDQEGKVSTWYGQPTSVPTTFVVDRRGQVVDVLVGARTAEEFRTAIMPHL